ncbi:MAG: exopolyphosphatase [Bacteroidetes bacterium]|jgi:exopolyphosphatase/guanosine-5'-triphosphate,3'-diphosphate pyrophosphatase|nr:exopolyphosphatase [Bacteroidota bacterium]
MTVAVIDCGTNTFHLLIASDENSLKVIFKKNIAVKLGQGGIANHIIAHEAFERGVDTMKEFAQIIAEFKTDKIIAYGTAALRKASNGSDFISEVKHYTGIEIQLIDGLHEAELIYYGVKQAYPLTDKKVLIMDIGGGSVEFIIADKDTIFWRHSFELGAALLLEKFKPSDPITAAEEKQINDFILNELAILFEALEQFPEAHTLVGSAGSFETFAEIISEINHHAPLSYKEKYYDIDIHQFEKVHELLLQSTTAERKQMKGIVDMRVDMIVIASMLLHCVIHTANINNINLSTYALKEGMLYFAFRKT